MTAPTHRDWLDAALSLAEHDGDGDAWRALVCQELSYGDQLRAWYTLVIAVDRDDPDVDELAFRFIHGLPSLVACPECMDRGEGMIRERLYGLRGCLFHELVATSRRGLR